MSRVSRIALSRRLVSLYVRNPRFSLRRCRVWFQVRPRRHDPSVEFSWCPRADGFVTSPLALVPRCPRAFHRPARAPFPRPSSPGRTVSGSVSFLNNKGQDRSRRHYWAFFAFESSRCSGALLRRGRETSGRAETPGPVAGRASDLGRPGRSTRKTDQNGRYRLKNISLSVPQMANAAIGAVT
jgi:hypothetical protein